MRPRRFQLRLTIVFIALCLVTTGSVASAQKLDAMKAAAAGSGSSSERDSSDDASKKKSSRNNHRHCDDDDDVVVTGFSELSSKVMLAALSSPFTIPRAVVADPDLHAIEFPAFPYSENRTSPLGDLFTDTEPSDWQPVLRGQYGDDFDGLSHASGRLLLDSWTRFGIDTEFFYRHEYLPVGGSDQLWTGDANIVYTFAKGDLGQFRTGIGVNWLAGAGQSDTGFNFTYGGELYPAEPFVITGDIDWGRIGDASLFHGRATVGITRDGWGLFTGYDYFSIGKTDLHSWINGVELRF
jgi:hypothetical protein